MLYYDLVLGFRRSHVLYFLLFKIWLKWKPGPIYYLLGYVRIASANEGRLYIYNVSFNRLTPFLRYLRQFVDSRSSLSFICILQIMMRGGLAHCCQGLGVTKWKFKLNSMLVNKDSDWLAALLPANQMPGLKIFVYYRKTSNKSRTLLGNKIVDNSDVVGASPVGAAPTTSSFHLNGF